MLCRSAVVRNIGDELWLGLQFDNPTGWIWLFNPPGFSAGYEVPICFIHPVAGNLEYLVLLHGRRPRMSSQSEPELPNIFENSKREINVLEWGKKTTQNPNVYKNCFVRHFTHVKDLDSPVFHEYLNVIVENTSNNSWTRLIVERQREQDQVIVGRWPTLKGYDAKWRPKDCFYKPVIALASSSSSSSSSGDLPLPLTTRSFQKNSCSVKLLARLLKWTHDKHPNYDLLKWNCYWYSYEIFEGVRAPSLNQVFEDYTWNFANWFAKKWRIVFKISEVVKVWINAPSCHKW